ncbi:hypothetical protein C0989_011495 [Termitomyces sp. Mn162]|nr:hypothetical protein C0989_011495 [Termitomyces sp. Mn162]
MLPTFVRLSKASRRPLTPKRGNKDYYKGTRQAFLPGGLRTGAPGKHVVGGKAKYRLLDDKVRVFVAPPIEEILSSPLKPYVSVTANLKPKEAQVVWGRFPNSRGLSAEHFLQMARERTSEELRSAEEANKPTVSWSQRLLSGTTDTTTAPTVADTPTPPQKVILEEIPTSTSQTTAEKTP